MRCSRCHSEFSSSDNRYCPVCGAPVRPSLPPLPPRNGLGCFHGCMLGCLISGAVAFVLFIVAPIALTYLLGRKFDVSALQTVEQMQQAFDGSTQDVPYKYNLYGTLGEEQHIRMTLDEADDGQLSGLIYIEGEDKEVSLHEVTGQITYSSGKVKLTIKRDEETMTLRGEAVTNPDGIVAIQGTTDSGEKLYVNRR